MKTNNIFIKGFIVSLLLFLPSKSYPALATYDKTTELICGEVKIIIITKCDDVEIEGPPQCDDQVMIFNEIKTGKKISTTAYGNPYDEKFKGAGTANAWQCVKGKNKRYLTLWYSTGGNCEECEWQGILDLKGNRISTDINKKKRTLFSDKWKSLGLPVLEPNDFTGIQLRKNE